MNIIFRLIITSIIIFFCISSEAQNYTDDDPGKFIAETKQVNQFIFRFNGEEDFDGKRYYPKDKLYRNKKLREKYLNLIFDNKNQNIKSSIKKSFIKDIVYKKPEHLNFYKKNWFAEVSTRFKYKGELVNIILYLQIEKHNNGYKWVIINLYFDIFNQLIAKNHINENKFIHPMSHELQFMNLRKIFNDKKNIEFYYDKDYSPDYKTLFLYEIKNGNLQFSEITNVKFHFFQINNYYFELSNFNRKDYNSGWLISKIFTISEKNKSDFIKLITRK